MTTDRNQQDVQPVDVATAAAALGISRDAVRSRIRRHKLDAVKDADSGEWRVYLPEGTRPAGEPTQADVTAELVRELRDRIGKLELALERQQELHAMLIRRMPQLPPPDDASTATAQAPEPSVEDAEQGPQIASKSLWERIRGR